MAVESFSADQVLEMLNKKLRKAPTSPQLNKRLSPISRDRTIEDFHDYSTNRQAQRDRHLTKMKLQGEYKDFENKTPPRRPPTPPGYVGPISGWSEHNQAFIEKRTREIKEFTFSPVIDTKSKQMMSSSVSFIDRVKHWNDKKLKILQDKRHASPKKRSPSPNIDPIKRGCEMHRTALHQLERKAIAADAVLKSMCTFKPKINPLSAELAAIARAKQRSKSPVNQSASSINLQPAKKLSKNSLNKFLERNYTSPLHRSKSPGPQRSNPDLDCTFSPSILNRSRDLSPVGDLYSRSQYLEVKKAAKLDNLRNDDLKREASNCTFRPILFTSKSSPHNYSTVTESTCAEPLNCVYRDSEGSLRVLDVYSYGDLDKMEQVDEIEGRLVI